MQIAEQFKYLDRYSSDIATQKEIKEIYKSFIIEFKNKRVDADLVPYLISLFDLSVLIPCFSCTGHGTQKGYILFKSIYPIEKTINLIFKQFYTKFGSRDGVEIALHFWPSGSIGYSLNFKTDMMKEVLLFLIIIIHDLKCKIDYS